MYEQLIDGPPPRSYVHTASTWYCTCARRARSYNPPRITSRASRRFCVPRSSARRRGRGRGHTQRKQQRKQRSLRCPSFDAPVPYVRPRHTHLTALACLLWPSPGVPIHSTRAGCHWGAISGSARARSSRNREGLPIPDVLAVVASRGSMPRRRTDAPMHLRDGRVAGAHHNPPAELRSRPLPPSRK